MINFYLRDANQEVRINARKAILTLEYGPEPLKSRQEAIKLIYNLISNQYDQRKMVEVLEKGPDDETLIPFAKSMSKVARMSTSGSISKKSAGTPYGKRRTAVETTSNNNLKAENPYLSESS